MLATNYLNWFIFLNSKPLQNIVEKMTNNTSQISDVPYPGRKVDVWSFGVFVLEMRCFPEHPGYFKKNFHHRTFQGLLAHGKINLLDYIKDDWEAGIKNIITQCLEVDETKRIGSAQLLQLCKDYAGEETAVSCD